MAVRYHLITRLQLSAGRSRTWDAFVEVREWPHWWRWLEDVEMLREGDADGVGTVFRPTISSPLWYGFSWQIEIVRVEKGSLVELDSSGALEGQGRFEISGTDGGPTEVVFTWLVATNKRWMNRLAPLARPVFTWSHDRLMADFGRGIAAETGGRLLSVTHQSVTPGSAGFFRMPGV